MPIIPILLTEEQGARVAAAVAHFVKKHGSQEHAAKAIGLSQGSVNRLGRLGKAEPEGVYPKSLAALAAAAKCSAEDILDGRIILPDAERELVRVDVQGWTLFAGGPGEHWIRDLDLAERAGLKNPYDIRPQIKTALSEGLIGAGSGDPNIPRGKIGIAAGDPNKRREIAGVGLLREVPEIVTSGKGRTQEVTAYYLNEDAALLIVTRLRTPKAIELTKAIVTVFLAVTRGALQARARKLQKPSTGLDGRLDAIEEELGALRAAVEQLTARRGMGARLSAIEGELGALRRTLTAPLALPVAPDSEKKAKLRGALRKLGFKAGDVERAIQQLRPPVEELPLPEAIRKTLAVLG